MHIRREPSAQNDPISHAHQQGEVKLRSRRFANYPQGPFQPRKDWVGVRHRPLFPPGRYGVERAIAGSEHPVWRLPHRLRLRTLGKACQAKVGLQATAALALAPRCAPEKLGLR